MTLREQCKYSKAKIISAAKNFTTGSERAPVYYIILNSSPPETKLRLKKNVLHHKIAFRHTLERES